MPPPPPSSTPFPSGPPHARVHCLTPPSSPWLHTGSTTPSPCLVPSPPVLIRGPTACTPVHPADASLARLLADITHAKPVHMLQTLLGFAPEFSDEFQGAVAEAGSPFVDILASYIHNIRCMSEDVPGGEVLRQELVSALVRNALACASSGPPPHAPPATTNKQHTTTRTSTPSKHLPPKPPAQPTPTQLFRTPRNPGRLPPASHTPGSVLASPDRGGPSARYQLPTSTGSLHSALAQLMLSPTPSLTASPALGGAQPGASPAYAAPAYACSPLHPRQLALQLSAQHHPQQQLSWAFN